MNGRHHHHEPDAEPDDEQRNRFADAIVRGAAIYDLPRPEPLVAGWLDLDSLAVLFGRPKQGKTFAAIDLALCVAAGRRWHGHDVTAGRVLYVAAEGAAGLADRVSAWCALNGDPGRLDDVDWLPMAPQLANDMHVAELCELVADGRYRLVVLDTLSRCMTGLDENSARDMSTVVANLDRVRRAAGACVLGVHHTPYADTAKMRGSTVLEGAVDTAVRHEADGAVVTLTATMVKNHAEPTPVRLVLTAAGPSVALAEYHGAATGACMTKAQHTVLAALVGADVGAGLSTTQWRNVSPVAESTFFHARKALLQRGFVADIGSESRPRYSATAEGSERASGGLE